MIFLTNLVCQTIFYLQSFIYSKHKQKYALEEAMMKFERDLAFKSHWPA